MGKVRNVFSWAIDYNTKAIGAWIWKQIMPISSGVSYFMKSHFHLKMSNLSHHLLIILYLFHHLLTYNSLLLILLHHDHVLHMMICLQLQVCHHLKLCNPLSLYNMCILSKLHKMFTPWLLDPKMESTSLKL